MNRSILILIFVCCVYFTFAQSDCDGGDGNSLPLPPPTNRPIGSATSSGAISADPNEITGPTGYDSLRWVSINDALSYTIYFENDPEFATAAAQKVNVSMAFPDKMLMKDFGVGLFSFANQSFPIENNPNIYQTRLDLRDSMKIYVDLVGGLDVMKQQAFWRFSSIDPESGYAPWQVDRGMLPVNDSTHVGEGFVTFHIKPSSEMLTGDTISLMANIVFDQNDTIPTNRWCNRVDAGSPTSKVIGTQDEENEYLYHLTFNAEDDEDGSGMKRVFLYYANNLGTYEEYAVCPTDTTLNFEIEPGRQYKFYSIGEDNVGNREALKEQPDLIINLNIAPTDVALSDSIFQDDLVSGGFIGELSSTDTPNDVNFTYALAEGEGAVHNDLFAIEDAKLVTNQTFMCAEDTVYSVRISTTDEGGLSFSKVFKLKLDKVLEKPKPDTINVAICEGDVYDFYGKEIDKAGEYVYSKSNEFMCDSVFVLNLTVKPIPQIPIVTIQEGKTLVSSMDNGNRWYKDSKLIEDATSKTFTPEETGTYYVVQSNGSCESAPSEKFFANLPNKVSYQLPLAKGWTWMSSNLSSTEKQDPKKLLAPIINNVVRFVGVSSELVADPNLGLIGDLQKVEPTELYKVLLNDPKELDMSGIVFLPDELAQPLHKGWNWIGYIPAASMALTDALANLSPSENDVIKGQSDFSTYVGGQWMGTLSSLSQNGGYMYYANVESSFNYPSNRITKVVENNGAAYANAYRVSTPWMVDEHKYSDNMSMIAQIVADGSKALAGAFTVGAFSGDECRGIGQYVNDRLFISIHGDANDGVISFKAIENATGNEYKVSETLVFANEAGNYNSPYILHISGTTGITDATVANSYTIYPNPVRSNLYINGNTDNIKGLRVISVSGTLIKMADTYNKVSGFNVMELIDGNYILGILTDKGIVYKRFIKIQQ